MSANRHSSGKRFRRFTNRIFASLLTGLLLIPAIGCRTVPPLAPVNLNEPGWTVRQGQAVWKRQRQAPEIAGEILLATGPNGRAFVQFTKNPFPLMIAQSTAETWQVEAPMENKRYSGRGKPPARLIFLWLPRALAGQTLPREWKWQQLQNNGWRLKNEATGEWLEVYFTS